MLVIVDGGGGDGDDVSFSGSVLTKTRGITQGCP